MGQQAMAFYHSKGLVPTWQMSRQYIGQAGRIAILPDIIGARLATEPGSVPWETWFTTLSAEYVGIGRSGRKIIIVAHGVGPMATRDGIVAAYRHEFADKERNNRGGRISIEEFHKLEDGHYGEVFIVDYESYVRRYEYPFLSYLRHADARRDPLFHARCGGKRRALSYIAHHARHARNWHYEQLLIVPEDHLGLRDAIGPQNYESVQWLRLLTHHWDRKNPFLLQIGDAANCPYHRPVEEGTALAHLLSIGRLAQVHHGDHESLTCDVGAHEWGNGCRFVGIPEGVEMTSVHPGWNTWQLMAQHWEKLVVPLPRRARIGIRPLMQLGDTWFTQYPSKGHSMTTGEPEFQVTGMEQIGEPAEFRTEIRGYHGFFRYDVQDVKAVAPPNAKGFVIAEPEIVWNNGDPTHHKAMVTFYRIKADTTRRLRQRQDIEGDYEIQLQLLATP